LWVERRNMTIKVKSYKMCWRRKGEKIIHKGPTVRKAAFEMDLLVKEFNLKNTRAEHWKEEVKK
jgi:hypothetical protein